MKRKNAIRIVALFSLLLFIGWGKKNVELLNDKKLIDLSKAIENCMPGAELPTKPEGTERVPDSGEEVSTGSLTEERDIIISVRAKKVTYDLSEWKNLQTLKEQIRQDYRETVTFILVDDFAEAHVYKVILKILSELETEIGLTYTRK